MKLRYEILAVVMLACSVSVPIAHANETATTEALKKSSMTAEQQSLAAAVADAAATQAVEVANVEKANDEFLGFKWGMGVAVSIDCQSGHRVQSASIVSGVVRVDEQNDIIPRIFLETHKFFEGGARVAVSKSGKALQDASGEALTVAKWGHGPFVGIQSSGENVIDAFAAGYMFGFRRKLDSDNSFNIGLGVVVDPKATVLGDGVNANQAPPAGETEVRLKKEARLGITLVYSFSF